MNRKKYYSFNRLKSYNAFINFSMGGRGIGKTYGCVMMMIDNFLEKKKQSVYIRRTESELDEVKATFFNAVRTDSKYEDVEMEVKGDYGLINGEIAIYFIALSTSAKKKSAAYPFVNIVVFDEYVMLSPRYLKNEMILFFELLETIFRSRNDGKVYILSNSISYVNPFFDEFGIEPKQGDRFIKCNDGLIVVEIIPPNDEFKKEKAETNLMRLLKGTKYYDYSVENKVLNDSEDFIIPKKPSGKYSFYGSFYSDGMEISFWRNDITGYFYVDQLSEKGSQHRYYLRMEDILPNFRYLKDYRTQVSRIRTIRKAIGDGIVYYKNQSIKLFVLNTLSRFI